MRPVTPSIAFIAVCLVHSLAAAEPAISPAARPGAASSLFADSFGLEAGSRTAALRPEGALAMPGQAWTPAADSFGLNRRLISTPACPGAEARPRPQADAQRCIRM